MACGPREERAVSQGLDELDSALLIPTDILGEAFWVVCITSGGDLWRERPCRSRGSFRRASVQIHRSCYTTPPPGKVWEGASSLPRPSMEVGTAHTAVSEPEPGPKGVSGRLHGTSERSNDALCTCAYAPAMLKKKQVRRRACLGTALGQGTRHPGITVWGHDSSPRQRPQAPPLHRAARYSGQRCRKIRPQRSAWLISKIDQKHGISV